MHPSKVRPPPPKKKDLKKSHTCINSVTEHCLKRIHNDLSFDAYMYVSPKRIFIIGINSPWKMIILKFSYMTLKNPVGLLTYLVGVLFPIYV